MPAPLDAALMAAFDAVMGDAPALGVAVSGGSDSTSLLIAAADWGRQRNRRIIAATVNHGLRREAAAEARAAGKLAARLGVAHTILHWRRPHGVRPGQKQAREARHRLLADWARDEGVSTLAIGHTRDDRIETFLIRLRAGSGWWGLAGPMPCSPSPVWPEGRGLRLARPLLGFDRQALRDALQRAGETWADDPTNINPAYERVRMRELAARLPEAARHRIVRIQTRLGAMRAAITAEARASLAAARRKDGVIRLQRESLHALSEDARLRLVESLVLAAGGSTQPVPAAALQRLAGDMVSIPGTGADGRAWTLAGAWIRWRGDTLDIRPAPARRGEPPALSPVWERADALLADPVRAGVFPPGHPANRTEALNRRMKVTAA